MFIKNCSQDLFLWSWFKLSTRYHQLRRRIRCFSSHSCPISLPVAGSAVLSQSSIVEDSIGRLFAIGWLALKDDDTDTSEISAVSKSVVESPGFSSKISWKHTIFHSSTKLGEAAISPSLPVSPFTVRGRKRLLVYICHGVLICVAFAWFLPHEDSYIGLLSTRLILVHSGRTPSFQQCSSKNCSQGLFLGSWFKLSTMCHQLRRRIRWLFLFAHLSHISASAWLCSAIPVLHSEGFNRQTACLWVVSS